MTPPRAVPLRQRGLAPRNLFLFAMVALAALGVSPGFSGDSRSGWPNAPLTRPAIPRVKHDDWVRGPIDAFVLARLEQAGLSPSPPADRLTLLRRVTYDLTGLAPTPEDIDAVLADRSVDWYERVVDRLLDSPRFGERWAQHWLDVVRYSETEGFKLDRWRPDAHRYRDYVIRAFNDDMPYDRFVRQQLAGDELEPDNPDALIATGLLRLHPEETNGANYRQIRQEILDDITDVFGATFLGMTLGCARCHDHKFDPIAQRDYYRLQAFFAPIIQHDDLSAVLVEDRRRHRDQLGAWETQTSTIRAEIDRILRPMGKVVFEESVVVFDPDTQEALRTSADDRSPLQRQLASLASKQIDRKYSRMHNRLSPEQRQRYEALKVMLAYFDPLKPRPLAMAMSVTDVGSEPPPTYRLANGNYLKPREVVQPGFPEFLEASAPDIRPPVARPLSTGRRSALARWLTRPDHPLTARVMVNRLWQQYFGAGIVGTPNDFGVMGEQATHPELLDFLADELVHHDWKLKRLHRTIVTSATYRQSSAMERNPTYQAAARLDAGDKLLWHARIRRRDAESIRDIVLQVSGQLNLRMYGYSAQPELPKPLMDSRYSWYPDEKPEDRNRRSVYVYARRNMQVPIFSAFDAPDRFNSCPTRAVTTTAPQALVMLNGQLTLEQARHLAGRLLAADGGSRQALIRRAYRTVFSREPTRAESAAAAAFLAHQAELIASAEPGPDTLPAHSPHGISAGEAGAVVDFCHALLNSAEFLYVE